jgi:ubiquinone/menaquinone biosynthesis C-methylase UbiE
VDFSEDQLEHARALRDLYGVDARFVEGDVTALPFAADAFDVAFSGWVFRMVEDLAACLAEARRVLRDGGVPVFDVPHPFYSCSTRSPGTSNAATTRGAGGRSRSRRSTNRN